MLKKLIIMLLCIGVIMLNSCEPFFFANDGENAKSKLEQVIESINSKDKDKLKSLFSKRALAESVDFDDSVDHLFEFIEGNIDEWEKPSGPTVYSANDYGHKWKEFSSYYYVTTDKQKYFFLIEDRSVDTDNPDNVGFHLFLIVKAEDHLKIYDSDNKILFDKIIENGEEKLVELTHIGIYIPYE